MSEDQQSLAEKALRLKQSEQAPLRPENEAHANEGPVMTDREDYAPSGAFDAEGQRPVLERSRKVR